MNEVYFRNLVIRFMLIALRYMWIDMGNNSRYSEELWEETDNLYREMKGL